MAGETAAAVLNFPILYL